MDTAVYHGQLNDAQLREEIINTEKHEANSELSTTSGELEATKQKVRWLESQHKEDQNQISFLKISDYEVQLERAPNNAHDCIARKFTTVKPSANIKPTPVNG